jgi:hypothetical protein
MSFDLELLKVPYNIAEALIPREDVQGELYMNYGVRIHPVAPPSTAADPIAR